MKFSYNPHTIGWQSEGRVAQHDRHARFKALQTDGLGGAPETFISLIYYGTLHAKPTTR